MSKEENCESGFEESPILSSENGNSPESKEILEPLRTSARVQRRNEERKESESDFQSQSEENFEKISDEKIQKRPWEQWSSEDKLIFFEALNECGKNFEAIEKFLRSKKKNKNKEQIRTFYYRTWHKISKYVDFPEEYQHLKKRSKELYGLINFGELRKRLGSQLDDKTGVKLRELIFKGHTNVKIKGL